MRELAGNPAQLAALAQRARPSVLGRTWERLGEELIGHYTVTVKTGTLVRRTEVLRPAA